MLFNSFPFIALLLATLTLYYQPWLRRYQIPTLIVASFVFYAYSNPSLVLLLIVSITVNTVASYRIMKSPSPSSRKGWAALGVAVNLTILAFFKYGGLIASSLHLATTAPDSFGYFLVTLPLPIGISFFTFQGISLVVDVFREHGTGGPSVQSATWQRHLLNTAFFKSFFPQLIAGPIVKAHDFYPQIGPKRLRDVRWEPALCALIAGYFLKMVVADNLRDLTTPMTYPYFQTQSTVTLLTLLFGYSMQIFADFAGYSLIAIGLARLFGYELMQNFNFPYISQSLSEFWRRWHISLSTWLREYLYIPLGGNRFGRLRTYANLLIVMTLGGLWHGTAWSYAVWGLYHGLGLALERAFRPRVAPDQSWRLWKTAAVFTFVTFGWLLFKLPHFGEAVDFCRSLVANRQLPSDLTLVSYILLYSAPVVLWHGHYVLEQSLRGRIATVLKPLVYATALTAILLNSGSPGAFIYFQF
jgi:alginate O-acetyltransferase complex protein AlgI